MAAPLVSVIIPTRNRRALLRGALASALGQQRVEVEVLVVDEASEDGTAAAVAALGDSRVTLVRHDVARGVAAARNAGLARARAPWVAFLDDDDLWAPTKLAVQLEAAARASADWVCVGAVIVDQTLTMVGGKQPPNEPLDIRDLLAFNVVPGGGSGPLVRTELARDVGGFDTDLAILADWDMWMRLALRTLPAMVPSPLVATLRHRGSMSHLNHGFSRELDRIAAKHAAARREHGAEESRDRWLRWEAAMHIRSGSRRQAIEGYAHLAHRYLDLKSVARAVAGALVPAVLVRHWSRNSMRLLPSGWCKEAEAWLAPLRAGAARSTAAGRSPGRELGVERGELRRDPSPV